jgi:hypothetical protein
VPVVSVVGRVVRVFSAAESARTQSAALPAGPAQLAAAANAAVPGTRRSCVGGEPMLLHVGPLLYSLLGRTDLLFRHLSRTAWKWLPV